MTIYIGGRPYRYVEIEGDKARLVCDLTGTTIDEVDMIDMSAIELAAWMRAADAKD